MREVLTRDLEPQAAISHLLSHSMVIIALDVTLA